MRKQFQKNLSSVRRAVSKLWQSNSILQPAVQGPDVALLEDRVLYSASPLPVDLVDPADGADSAADGSTLELYEGLFNNQSAIVEADRNAGLDVHDVAAPKDPVAELASDPSESADAGARLELVFVDPSAEDYDQLVNDLLSQQADGRRFDVVVLDAGRDGIQQISKVLAERQDVDAVHIVSHGSDGRVKLGDSWLSLDNVGAYAGQLVGWRDALTNDADLLFYGCDLAASEDGQTLVESLGTLTGADAAASVDDTGHRILGGDWDLEYVTGSIETGIAFSLDLQQNWGHLLDVTVDATSTGTSSGGDFSIPHTTAGTERLMLVGVSLNLSGGSETVSSVTYNGNNLSLVGVEEAGDARIEIWALLAPDVGTFNVDIAFSSPTDGNTAGVMTFAGVDPSTPLGAFGSDFGYGESTASATVSSAADELVFGVVSIDDPNYRVLTEGGGQTETWELFADQVTGGGSTAPGDPSVNMSWTWAASDNWAAGGVSIKPAEHTLWLTTFGDVVSSGAPGLSNWSAGEILEFGNPNLSLGSPTNGTFSSVQNLDAFDKPTGAFVGDANVDIDAIHYVATNMTIGGTAGQVNVQAGDLLLSTNVFEELESTNTLTVNAGDVFIFRPDTPGDYSAGTFEILIDAAGLPAPLTSVSGVSLVETTTSVGGTNLNAGTFLLLDEGNPEWGHVYHFDPRGTGGVGLGSTSGTQSILIDGNNNIATAKPIRGVELIETATTVGVESLAAGELLLTLDVDDVGGGPSGGVGDNNEKVAKQDIWVLNVTATGDDTTAGTARMFLDGSAVGLDAEEEDIHGLTLFTNAAPPLVNTLVVDTASDIADGDTSSISNLLASKGADGFISLREAIEAANATPNGATPDRIEFNIGGGGLQTILVNGPSGANPNGNGLDYIVDPVIIDATTQPGYAGTPLIQLDGTNAAGSSGGLILRTDDSTIKGFIVHSFPDDGIEMDGSTGFGDNNTIQNNWIGIDDTQAARPNGDDGLLIAVDAVGNQIGGSGPNEGNVISASTDYGIAITTAGSTNNVIEGNLIGTDAAGTAPLGNGLDGIWLESSGNTITGNVIAASGDSGIEIGNGATGNVVQGNYIGTDLTATIDLGNAGSGIVLFGAGTANNTIGGTGAGEGNVVAHSGNDGIYLNLDVGGGNALLGNTIFDSGGLGIELTESGPVYGVTANDAGDGDGGPNALQNFPVLTSAQSSGTQLTITGSLNSTASRTFRIELFSNSATDTSGHGEGQTYLGFVNVTTDGSGNAAINTTLPVSVGADEWISATATDLTTNNTSEFAQSIEVNERPTIVSDGGGAAAAIEVAENSTTVTTVIATDADLPAQILAYSIIGGADAAQFTIDGASGLLTFVSAPDYETPTDAGANNVYDATVQVSDGNGGTDTQAIAVTVTNVNEKPNIDFPPLQTTFQDSPLVLSTANGNVITLSDVDLGGGDLEVTLSVDHGTLTLSGLAGLTFGSGDGTNDPSMTFTGSVADVNNALDGLTFNPTPGYNGYDQITILVDDQGGSGSGGPQIASNTVVMQIGAISYDARLWLSTEGDEGSSDAPGLDSWTEGQAIGFGRPNFALEPGVTSGSFSPAFNLDNFDAGTNTDLVGIHYVSRDMTVGGAGGTFDLKIGDLLLSTKDDETLTGHNTISVTKDEIFVFRPDGLNDYSNGTFYELLDDFGSLHGDNETLSLTLVEEDTLVGDVTLTAGTFLFSRGGGSEEHDIYQYVSTGVGVGSTSGSVSVLIEGDDIDVSKKIWGLDLVETPETIGGVSLASGTILVTLDADDSDVGDNLLDTNKHDIFYLTVSTTGVGTSAATATLLLEGADVNLDAGAETLDALTIVPAFPPALDLDADDSSGQTGADYATTFIEGGGAILIADSDASLTDIDSGLLSALTVTITNPLDGAAELLWADTSGTSIIANYDPGTGILQLTGDDFVAKYEQVLRTVTYENTSGGPDVTPRVITFTADDAYRTSNVGTATVSIIAVNNAPLLDATGTMTLTDINEDDFASAGDTVAGIVASAGGDRITDADPNPQEGIAVVGVDDTNGTWQYNAGAGWTDFGLVSNTSAVLLDPAALIRFVPVANYNGSAGNITFRAWDQTDGNSNGDIGIDVSTNGGSTAYSSGTETASLNVIPVNDPPLAVDDGGSVDEGASVNIDLAGNDSDIDDGLDLTSITIVSGPSNGSLVINADGTVDYTHDGSETLSDSFTYTIRDNSGAASNVATVNLTINPQNDAPVNSVPIAQFTETDTPLTFSTGSGNAILIADDSGAGSLLMELSAINGTLTLNGTSGLTFGSGDGTADALMSFTGLLADINNALDGMIFTPDAGYSGAASVVIMTDDQGNTGAGGAQGDADIVGITVGSSTLIFQQGTAGYFGTEDNELQESDPATAQGNNTSISVDLDNGGGVSQGVIQFDSIFGNGPGQIPWGSTINSASLTVYVFETSNEVATITMHEMLVGWDESSTWNSLVGGVQLDDAEAASSVDSTLAVSEFTGPQTFYGLESTVQSWSDGAANNGWVIVTDDTDGWDFHSSEYATVAERPVLTIDYTAPQPPALDLDADNSSGQTGADFAAAFVEDGGPVAITDLDATLTDTDDTNLQSLTVTITNLLDGAAELLAANTSGTSITAAYDSGTGILSLTGTDTVANYQQVLRTITYDNSSDTPDETARAIEFVTNDGMDDSNVGTTTLSVTAVNDPPTTTGIADVNVNEDAPDTVIDLFAAFDDAEDPDAALTYSITGNTNPGLFTATTIDGVAGTLTLDYAPDQNGSTDITVRATDTSGDFVETTFTVTVNPVNDPPTTSGIADVVVDEDAPDTVIDLFAAFDDIEDADAALTYSITANTNAALFDATMIDGVAGTLTLDYAPDQNGTADFTVRSTDSGGDFVETTFTVTVNPINDPPTTSGIPNVTVDEDAPDTVIDLFAAFDDIEDADAALSYSITANTNAALFNATTIDGVAGTLTLDYAPDQNGSANITVRATDSGGDFVETTFTVTVNPINDPPTTSGIPNVTVDEDAPDTVIDLFAAFDDIEDADSSLTYSITGNTNAALFNATTIDGVAGTLTLDYAPDQNGTADITVRATDTGGDFVETTFTVTINPVNDPPTTSGIADVTVDEDAADTVIDLFAAFADIEDADAALTYSITANTNAALFNATTIDGVAGTLTLDYAPDQNGTADITVRATDTGGDFVETTFTVTVNPVNDVPTTSGIADVVVDEDAADTVIDLFAAFADIEDADTTLTYSITGNTNAGLFAATTIDGVAGTLTLDYAPNQNGTADITVRATDTNGDFVETTFTVTVNPVNDPPTTSGIADVVVDEDAADTVIDLFAAFDDIEDADAALTYSITSNTNAGLFAATTIDGVAGTLTLDYAPDQNGTADITVRATDTNGDYVETTFTVTVNPVNDPPTTTGIANVTVDEDAADTVIDLFAAFDDIEDADSALTYSITGNTNAGLFNATTIDGVAGTLTLDYAPDQNGTADIRVRATDSGGDFVECAFTVTVNPVNDVPTTSGIADVTVDEDAADTVIDLFAAFDDIEDADAALTYSITGNTNAGLFTATTIDGVAGTLTLDYAPDQNGTADITVRATDSGGDFVETTFTVTVNPVNDVPTTSGIADVVVDEDAADTVIDLFAAFDDIEDADSALTYSITGNTNAALFNATTIDGVAGTLTLDYAPDQNGTADITVRATDSGGDSVECTFTVTVNPVNDVPTTSGIADVTVNEDAPDTVIDLFAAFDDIEDADAALTYSITGNTNAGLFAATTIDGVAGTLTLDYAPDQNGTADITVRATDSGGAFVETTFTVTVNPVNDAPVLGSNTLTIEEGGTVTLSAAELSATDVDNLNGTLTLTVTNVTNGRFELASNTGVAIGSFTQNQIAAGGIVFVHNGGEAAPSYEVAVSDGALVDGPLPAAITFANVNDAPTADSASFETNNVENVVVGAPGLLAGASDAEGDPLAALLVHAPVHGSVTINADGSFQYVPDPNYAGADSFTFVVHDGMDSSALQTVAITIAAGGGPSDPGGDTNDDGGGSDDNTNDPHDDDVLPGGITPHDIPADGTVPHETDDTRRHHSDSDVLGNGVVAVAAVNLALPDVFDTGLLGGDALLQTLNQLAPQGARPAVAAAVESAAASPTNFVLDTGLLWEQLDELQEQFESNPGLQDLLAGSATVAAATFSAGMVFWVLRGGYFLSLLLTSMPAWRYFDPLPIFAGRHDHKDDEPESEQSNNDFFNDLANERIAPVV